MGWNLKETVMGNMEYISDQGDVFITLATHPREGITSAMRLEVNALLAQARKEKIEDDGIKSATDRRTINLTYFPISPFVQADSLFRDAVAQYRREAPTADIARRARMHVLLEARLNALDLSAKGIQTVLEAIDSKLAKPPLQAPAPAPIAATNETAELQQKPGETSPAPAPQTQENAARPSSVAPIGGAYAPVALPKPKRRTTSSGGESAPAPAQAPRRVPPMESRMSIAERIAKELGKRSASPANYAAEVISPAPAPRIVEDETPGANPWGLPVEWAGDDVINRIARTFEAKYSHTVSGQRSRVEGEMRASLKQAGLSVVDCQTLGDLLVDRMRDKLGLGALSRNKA